MDGKRQAQVVTFHGESNSIFRVIGKRGGFIKDYSLQSHGIHARELAEKHARLVNMVGRFKTSSTGGKV